MTVLVTGGAGFLGINLVRYLLREGAAVATLDFAPFDYPERPRIREIRGDIRDSHAVRAAMEGVDCVVHAAAALPLYKKEDIYSTDVDGTRTVLATAREAGITRVVHVSSTAVYGIPDHHPIDEDDRLEGVGPYGEAKILAEQVCTGYRSGRMCVPILRPKSFVGPERLGVFSLLYEWAADGRGFPVIGRGENRYQLLDVEDLCRSIHSALTLPAEAANDTFNIGAAEFATIREDFQAVLDYAGHGKRVVGLPARPVVFALRALERLGVSPLYQWVYETAGRDSEVSVAKARDRLGFTPRYSNRDALLRNFRWYLDNRESFQSAHGISHRSPWKQGVFRYAKLFF